MFSKYLAATSLLLGEISASAVADENWTNTLASCLDFASQFDNTCTSTSTQLAFGSIPTASVTCSNVGACAGTTSGDNCTWDRKLCVTCFDDAGTTRIRVQTDGLPNHCYRVPSTAPQAQQVDFTVDWLAPAQMVSRSNVNDQASLNELICNIQVSKDTSIPSYVHYVKNSGSSQNTAFGVAITGVLIFNSISGEGVDPFYPAAYGSVTDPDSVVEKVDWCIAHPQVTGIFHYHSAATCVANTGYINTKSGHMSEDVNTVTRAVWKGQKPYRSAFGISKDGRPMLSPMYGNGQEYDNCDVDVCNGMDINGNYMYVTTFFHPYIQGCYGRGSAPELYQQCSSNPRLCNVVYQGAVAGVKPISWFFAGLSTLFLTYQTIF